MADFMFDKALQKFASAQIDWLSDVIKFAAVNKSAGGGWTPSQTTDEFLSIIPGAGIIARSLALASKTNTGGVCDAADFVFTSVTGAVIQCLVLYKDTGVDATSPILAHIDSYLAIPYTPTGADIPVALPNNVNKIFKI